ncbi:MAG: TetR/AcrR family transcriptional regulator [Burkholderiaceae bacterium]
MSSSSGKRAAKPLKRPSQARAKFTVQAIYDAFVRIWQRDGWDGVTTRAVALETGISVGTLYDYFPNKLALLSGYVRHCIDALLNAIEQQAVQPMGLTWQQRVHQLVRLSCGVDAPELPWFHPDMLVLEGQIAEPKHHRRVHEELGAAWIRVFTACDDLPHRPADDMLKALQLAVWGGRRYGLLVALSAQEAGRWAADMERMCCAVVRAGSD